MKTKMTLRSEQISWSLPKPLIFEEMKRQSCAKKQEVLQQRQVMMRRKQRRPKTIAAMKRMTPKKRSRGKMRSDGKTRWMQPMKKPTMRAALRMVPRKNRLRRMTVQKRKIRIPAYLVLPLRFHCPVLVAREPERTPQWQQSGLKHRPRQEKSGSNAA